MVKRAVRLAVSDQIKCGRDSAQVSPINQEMLLEAFDGVEPSIAFEEYQRYLSLKMDS